jgi:uncharacterized GH25 family protein
VVNDDCGSKEVFFYSQEPPHPCKPAQNQDRPHGANEIIEYHIGTVKRIRGKILTPLDEPINEAVVEIYEYTDADKNLDAYHIVNSKERRAACLTDKKGNFCFTNLPSGIYAIRAGTRQPSGFQEVFIKVRLDRHWWSSWLRSRKDIEIKLPLGT